MAGQKTDYYITVAGKYGLQGVEAMAADRRKVMKDVPFTVGIIGNNFKVIPIVAMLTGMNELDGMRACRSFIMEISDGKENRCFQMNGEKMQEISFQEMRKDLEETDSLDSEEQLPALHIRLTAAGRKMEGIRLLAIGSAGGFQDINWEEVWFRMDERCMALSATRLLDMEERSLIKKPEMRMDTYILADMNQVPEKEGRSAVWKQLNSFVGGDGKNIVSADDRESVQELWGMWNIRGKDMDTVAENREKELEEAIGRKLESGLEKRKEVCQTDSVKIQNMEKHLAKAYEELPSNQERTVRHIRMYYLEELKSELDAEILKFHTKLKQDLRTGIDEERDLKQLQKALVGYVTGEWENFLGETLQSRMKATAERMDQEIENYMKQNIETILKSCLSEEEYSDLKHLLSKYPEDRSVSVQDADMEMQEGSVLFESSSERPFYGLLPKCVMAAGGIAILCSAFLPGALLVFIGYQMNIGAGEEEKERLYREGKEMSDQCMKEVQKKIQEAFEIMEKETAELVGRCYDTVMERLAFILKDLKERDAQIQKSAAQIEAQIEELREKRSRR